ncbi:MOSC domain-containing protein [Aliiroseovarius sp. KMU-50]|uniref:MOSC domain-containing protein n=1 Tax=Aliiroseovarius salicola TaxID=3009082 RepID=A0ABT4VYG2_9RHOB|nr:MOSC domain-containing protein [Aliiroseovarius sp. KMU-50]MDA5093301.1 MOSC domain-containing protein [Aliiroseovarius sp. KMU-50]
MGQIAQIWRHPIKSHGREALAKVDLTAGQCLPYDRHWAVAHEAAKLPSDGGWAPCNHFSRGSKAPLLQALSAKFDQATNTVTLTHPNQPGITLNPDLEQDQDRFISWVTPLCPRDRALPNRIVAAGRGMTDTDFPSISLINLASHAEVETRLGQEISPLRWRGNILLANLPAWEERGWIGKRIRLGEAVLEVREQIVRCLATTASTRTGERDADTLKALQEGWGHKEMGVYAVVVEPGQIVVDDKIEVL